MNFLDNWLHEIKFNFNIFSSSDERHNPDIKRQAFINLALYILLPSIFVAGIVLLLKA